MQSITPIDDKCNFVLHNSIRGEAFAINNRNRLAIFGGEFQSIIVDLTNPSNILQKHELKTPLKWYASTYEWDPHAGNPESCRYLQTRNKIIEIVSLQTGDVLVTHNGHKREINEAKWSPFKRNLLASSSVDQSVLLWSTEMPKPIMTIQSLGDPNYLAWNKIKDNVLAVSCGNDIRIYDLRKANTNLKYINKAHTKKIYSLDWSNGPATSDEILLSSSRDGTIKLWNVNMIYQKFMQIRLEDFPCWKAKFTPYGLCFAVIPTCQVSPIVLNSQQDRQSPLAMYNRYPLFTDEFDAQDETIGLNNTSSSSDNMLMNNTNTTSNDGTSDTQSHDPNMLNASLLICQVTSLNQGKIFKYVSNKMDMMLDFDFYIQDDKCSVVSWTDNQYLCMCNLDLQQFAPKDGTDRPSSSQTNTRNTGNSNSRDEQVDSVAHDGFTISRFSQQQHSLSSQLHHLSSATANSSRKSSISEFGYNTPPTNPSLSLISSRTLVNDNDSITLSDDYQGSDLAKTAANSMSISNPSGNLLKSSSGALILTYEQPSFTSPVLRSHHEKFIVPFPRIFGAKFSGLPEQMLIFRNEDFSIVSLKSNFEFNLSSLKHMKRTSHSHKSKQQQQSHRHHRHHPHHYSNKSAINRCYILDISNLLSISRELAERYSIIGDDLSSVCDQNIAVAIQSKRLDLVKIWEILKFITMNNSETISLNPDDGRPWSSSIFGRPLVNYLIDWCIKFNDIQTAVMIISKLKQHDMRIVPNASTVHRYTKSHKLSEKFTIDERNSSESSSFTEYFDCNISNQINNSSFNLQSSLSTIKDDTDLEKLHQYNLCLLDQKRMNEFDVLIKYYCDLLYRWGLYLRRIELMEFLSEKPLDYEKKFSCATVCSTCMQEVNREKCNTCKSYLLYCSLCQFPVHGLSTFCVCCGHGGHYDHMIDWFKKHDDCPSACGCRCVDYL